MELHLETMEELDRPIPEPRLGDDPDVLDAASFLDSRGLSQSEGGGVSISYNATVSRGGTAMGSEPLTPRQLQVLRLVAQGKTSREIAREMGISVGTVRRHLQERPSPSARGTRQRPGRSSRPARFYSPNCAEYEFSEVCILATSS